MKENTLILGNQNLYIIYRSYETNLYKEII